jgi:AcrR family transcriptional regulator
MGERTRHEHVNEQEQQAAGVDKLVPVTARGEATRRKILDAAEAIFGEMGYYEGSISAITRRAGVAQGTFYLYFHSKREIFVMLIADIGMRFRAATSAASAAAPTRLEAEQRGYRAFFDFVCQHRRVYQIVQEAERVAPEAARDYYRRISSGYQHGLSRAARHGEVRDLEPEAIAYALMGIAHFVALRWIIWPWEQEGEQTTPHVPEDVQQAIFAFVAHGLARDDAGPPFA